MVEASTFRGQIAVAKDVKVVGWIHRLIAVFVRSMVTRNMVGIHKNCMSKQKCRKSPSLGFNSSCFSQTKWFQTLDFPVKNSIKMCKTKRH